MWKWECGSWFGGKGRGSTPNVQRGISAGMARAITGYWEGFAAAQGGCRAVGWWHHHGLASPVGLQLGARSCPCAPECLHVFMRQEVFTRHSQIPACWLSKQVEMIQLCPRKQGMLVGFVLLASKRDGAVNILAVLSHPPGFPQTLPLELGMFLQLC